MLIEGNLQSGPNLFSQPNQAERDRRGSRRDNRSHANERDVRSRLVAQHLHRRGGVVNRPLNGRSSDNRVPCTVGPAALGLRSQLASLHRTGGFVAAEERSRRMTVFLLSADMIFMDL